MDSIRAVEKVASSPRIRAIAIAVWAVAGPLLYAGAGWVASRIAIADELAKMNVTLVANTRSIEALTLEVAKQRGESKENIIVIGKQAAYATAGFQAYEPTRPRAQKRAYAEKYAHSYETSVKGGKSPELAYAELEAQVSIP